MFCISSMLDIMVTLTNVTGLRVNESPSTYSNNVPFFKTQGQGMNSLFSKQDNTQIFQELLIIIIRKNCIKQT
jgi:hypothetical protein